MSSEFNSANGYLLNAMQRPPKTINLVEADDLFGLIDTQAKYDKFKQWFDAVKHRNTRTGPFYDGLPSRAHPIDVYDPDKVLLGRTEEFRSTYARLLHLSLSGQYRLSEAVPRMGSGRLLDLHSLNSMIAPFKPIIDPTNVTSTAARQWDRNAVSQLGREFAPIAKSANELYFNERPEMFQQLIPLYTNYTGGSSSNNNANQCGFIVNANTFRLFQIIKAFLASANEYQIKLEDTAQVYHTGTLLERTRNKLIDKLAALQRDKYEQLVQAKARDDLTPNQRRLIDAFNVSYRRTVQTLNRISTEDYQREKARRASKVTRRRGGGVGGGRSGGGSGGGAAVRRGR